MEQQMDRTKYFEKGSPEAIFYERVDKFRGVITDLDFVWYSRVSNADKRALGVIRSFDNLCSRCTRQQNTDGEVPENFREVYEAAVASKQGFADLLQTVTPGLPVYVNDVKPTMRALEKVHVEGRERDHRFGCEKCAKAHDDHDLEHHFVCNTCAHHKAHKGFKGHIFLADVLRASVKCSSTKQIIGLVERLLKGPSEKTAR
eukprot:7689187-Pyramimonas_sp.AAC.1